MTDDEIARIAQRDQDQQAVIDHAHRVSLFYSTLIVDGIESPVAIALTHTFMDNDRPCIDEDDPG